MTSHVICWILRLASVNVSCTCWRLSKEDSQGGLCLWSLAITPPLPVEPILQPVIDDPSLHWSRVEQFTLPLEQPLHRQKLLRIMMHDILTWYLQWGSEAPRIVVGHFLWGGCWFPAWTRNTWGHRWTYSKVGSNHLTMLLMQWSEREGTAWSSSQYGFSPEIPWVNFSATTSLKCNLIYIWFLHLGNELGCFCKCLPTN